jgi:hypothetical protein
MPAQPYIAAFPKMNLIVGHDWPMGATVHLTIDDPRTAIRPDYETEQPTEMTSWDPNTFWVQFYFSYDLKVGDRITETDGYVTRTYTVRTLDVSDVSLAGNNVAGIADPFAVVYLWVWGHNESYMELTAKKNGTWLADFNSVGFTWLKGCAARPRCAIGSATGLDLTGAPPTRLLMSFPSGAMSRVGIGWMGPRSLPRLRENRNALVQGSPANRGRISTPLSKCTFPLNVL